RLASTDPTERARAVGMARVAIRRCADLGGGVVALLDRIASPVVGDYFDMGNMAAFGMDPAEEARRRRGRIVQVHAKGARGAPLDAGTVDLDAVRQALGEIGYEGWLVLETDGGDDPVA